MAEIIDDVAHLTQEIGPHPAGTEEEQQAALYLAEKLQREAGFATIIEDFQCATNAQLPRLICFGAALIAAIVALVLPVVGLPCMIVALIAAVLQCCEVFGKPVLSRLFKSGASQNVVAKYQPAAKQGVQRRRKIILVANYDTGKVLKEEQGGLAKLLPLLQKICLGGLIALPILLLLRSVVFAADTGAVSSVLSFLIVICALLVLLPLVRSALHMAAPYSQGANNNSAGVSVLLDVARQVGNGLVSSEEAAERAEREGSRVQGEEAARAAGVVPEGASLEYEDNMSPQESLAAAKAAIAALTGKPVADKVPVVDISSRLVKGGGFDPVDEEAASSVRFEEYEAPQRPARPDHEPLGRRRVTVTVDDPEPVDPIEEEVPAAEVPAPAPEPVAVPVEPVVAEERQSFERSTPAALQPGVAGSSVGVDKTPAWARSAQQKARANKPEASQPKAVSRSRYADAPAAHIAEGAAVAGGALAGAAASGEAFAAETEVPSELSSRLAALRDEIASAEAPRFSEETQAAIDELGEAPAAPEEEPAARVVPVTPERTVRAEEPAPVAAAPTPAPAPAEEAPSKTVPVAPVAAAPSREAVEEPKSAAAAPHATTAMSPIDVSSFLDREEPEEEAAPAAEPSARFAKRISRPAPVARPVSADEEFEGMGDDLAVAPAAPAIDVVNERTQRVSSEQIQEAIQQASERAVDLPPREDSAPAADVSVASPIVGMEDLIPQVPEPVEEGDQRPASRQVIVLPDVVTAHATSEEQKQRAPMAESSSSTKAGSKALLSNMLPRIDGQAAAAPATSQDTFGLDLPALGDSGLIPQQSAVSATGSFSTVGGTGSFAPVGDELVADVDPEDRYIDDADDSSYSDEYTETGAFAGPDYVDMPKSRMGRLFGRFRSKKKEEESSVRDWVNVDENYEARSVGKARGDWSSFRQEDAAEPVESGESEFVDVDFHDTSFNKRDWNGGAFSLSRLRQGIGRKKDAEPIDELPPEDEFVDELPEGEPVVERVNVGEEDYDPQFDEARFDGDAAAAEQINRELRKLQDFRHPDIDTEVWFVALGAEMYTHSGMQAFLDEHADEMKGAVVVNLEALGAGTLSLVESEGAIKPSKVSSRVKRYLRQASDRSEVPFHTDVLKSRETAAALAMSVGAQAFTVAGMGEGNTALYSADNDVIENIDPAALDEASAFVMALIKSI